MSFQRLQQKVNQKIAELQQLVAKLQQQVVEDDQKIAELQQQVAGLQQQADLDSIFHHDWLQECQTSDNLRQQLSERDERLAKRNERLVAHHDMLIELISVIWDYCSPEFLERNLEDSSWQTLNESLDFRPS